MIIMPYEVDEVFIFIPVEDDNQRKVEDTLKEIIDSEYPGKTPQPFKPLHIDKMNIENKDDLLEKIKVNGYVIRPKIDKMDPKNKNNSST